MYWSGNARASSANVAGTDGKPQGVPFWRDAALFNSSMKGIPSIVFGPGDVGVAHSNHEFVPVDELTKGAQVYPPCWRRRSSARRTGGTACLLDVRNLSVSFPDCRAAIYGR